MISEPEIRNVIARLYDKYGYNIARIADERYEYIEKTGSLLDLIEFYDEIREMTRY